MMRPRSQALVATEPPAPRWPLPPRRRPRSFDPGERESRTGRRRGAKREKRQARSWSRTRGRTRARIGRRDGASSSTGDRRRRGSPARARSGGGCVGPYRRRGPGLASRYPLYMEESYRGSDRRRWDQGGDALEETGKRLDARGLRRPIECAPSCAPRASRIGAGCSR